MTTAKATFLLALTLAGCTSQPAIVPVRNLERPSDMTFVCLGTIGADADRRISGRPMARCHPPSADDPAVFGEPLRTFGTFSFITNTARGELSVADMDTAPPRLIDLDGAQPGYNTLPIGTFPDAIASTQDGCRIVTANRGSCDLAVIDPQRLLAPAFGIKSTTGDNPVVVRVPLTTASMKPLKVPPREVVFLPQPWSDLETQLGEENVCVATGATPSSPRVANSWRALVTLPGCDLVAMVDLPSGKIVSSTYIRPEGSVDAGAEPVCPDECGTGLAAAGEPPPAAGRLRVGSLALLPAGNRVYVGAEGGPFVTALDITPQGLVVPADGGRIPLHDDAGGVTRLRLAFNPYLVSEPMASPDPAIPATRWLGRPIGSRGQFLYAFARDESIRVIDVQLSARNGMKEGECDTQLDPLFLPAPFREVGCLRIGDPQWAMVPRRALSQGPGVRIPSINPDAPPPLPRDIAFSATKGVPKNATSNDAALDADFAFVLSSSGAVYLLNLDPQVDFFSRFKLMNHSFADANLTVRGLGTPRVTVLPARNFTATEVPLPVQLPVMPLRGPRVESFPDTDAGSATAIQSWVKFPDPTAPSPQGWTITWEGELPGASRVDGKILGAGATPGPAGALEDLGADFCDAGALTGDIVLFPGCSQDADCQPVGTAVCRQAAAGTPGLCFPKTAARDDQFVARCRRHLGSRHRYEVVASTPRRLDLGLKLDEVPRTSVNPCTPHASEAEDVDCRIAPAYDGFRCLQVRTEEKPRCVHPCGTRRADGAFAKDDRKCRVGTVCEDVPGSTVGPLCVEGPPLDASCWPTSANYRVQTGRSFLVSGAAAPRPAVALVDGGQCVPDGQRHPFLIDRIPLDAPHCQDVPDGTDAATALGAIPSGPAGSWGNPCLFSSSNLDEPSSTPRPPHVKALFENQQLRLVMTNLDEFVGDAAITHFDVTGGFVPLTADYPDDIIITAGVRMLQGPMKTPESPGSVGNATSNYVAFPYLFVVDQGRTVSAPGARGQILRLNPRSGTLGIPRFDGIFTAYQFQLQ